MADKGVETEKKLTLPMNRRRRYLQLIVASAFVGWWNMVCTYVYAVHCTHIHTLKEYYSEILHV